MKFKNIFFCLAVISICAVASFSQDDRVVNDNAMTDELRKDGVKYETKRAIVWAEKGSLTEQEINEFAALVNQGIISIEKYTGIRFNKKYYQAKKIEYFLSSKAGISHTADGNKPYIYITPTRIKNKKAPYLHETTHVIAWISLKSLWLQEGFANYVQTYVSKHYGGYNFMPFNPDNKDVNQLAKSILISDISKKVLPLIGLNEIIQNLSEDEFKKYNFIFEDRKVAAPAFYNLSESFVRFIMKKLA